MNFKITGTDNPEVAKTITRWVLGKSIVVWICCTAIICTLLGELL